MTVFGYSCGKYHRLSRFLAVIYVTQDDISTRPGQIVKRAMQVNWHFDAAFGRATMCRRPGLVASTTKGVYI